MPMPVETDLMALMRGAEPVVAKAAATLVEMQRAPRATTRKELRDIVTDADLAAERIVIDGLKALTPGAAILSEERGSTGGASLSRWIIDPLDGTVNYAAGLPWFSVSAAYHDGGEALVGLIESPLADIRGRYVRGALATVNDEPVRVSDTRALADAVVSVILTSHYQPDEVRMAAAIVERRPHRSVGRARNDMDRRRPARCLRVDQGRPRLACRRDAAGARGGRTRHNNRGRRIAV
jgi:myo-inositol-1(or 4)-monophosphatase